MRAQAQIKGLAALFAVVILLHPVPSTGQSIWTDQQVRNGLSLEILKPSFEESEGLTLATSVNYLSGRFGISEGSVIEAEIPISHWGYSSDFGSDSQTSVGNPYLGLLFSGKSVFLGRIGLRLPLASEDSYAATSMGVITDYDRLEAFLPNVVTVAGSFGTQHGSPGKFGFNWGLGPVVLISTEDVDEQVEVLTQYRLGATYGTDVFSIGGGFTGKGLITEPDLSFDERTVHQFTLVATAHFAGVHPGMYMRFPIDDDLEALNFTLGLNVMIAIGKPTR
jgi:hypothetical protein